ncbi:MAG: magnesium chelatase, partial [Pseudohongiellaceae bacterium]
ALVGECRQRQMQRGGRLNAALSLTDMQEACALQKADAGMLQQAVTRLKLSTRAYHRILKIARTIADLAQQDQIGRSQLLEAINYRQFDQP